MTLGPRHHVALTYPCWRATETMNPKFWMGWKDPLLGSVSSIFTVNR